MTSRNTRCPESPPFQTCSEKGGEVAREVILVQSLWQRAPVAVNVHQAIPPAQHFQRLALLHLKTEQEYFRTRDTFGLRHWPQRMYVEC